MRLVACGHCHSQFDVSLVQGGEFRCHCGGMVSSAPRSAVDAPIHRCGSCGALIEAAAASCDYCHSEIVRDKHKLTLICPECYARSSGDAGFCSHCGVEFRPQPIPTAGDELECPRCEQAMLVRSIGGVRVDECPGCSGLWIPGDNFDALVSRAIEMQRARPSEGLGAPPRRSASRARVTGRVVYRRCPVCGSPMLRKNFARVSGVIVDWCGQHGTWLDPDELEAIAAFIQSGRLEEAMKEARQSGGASAETSWRSASPQQIEALLAAERIMAEGRVAQARRRRLADGADFRVRFSLGDLLRGLLGH